MTRDRSAKTVRAITMAASAIGVLGLAACAETATEEAYEVDAAAEETGQDGPTEHFRPLPPPGSEEEAEEARDAR